MIRSKEVLGKRKSVYYYTAVAAGSAVALATSYAVYDSYRRDVHGKSARYIKKVWKSAQEYLEAFSIGGEICRRVARDVESYLLRHEEEEVGEEEKRVELGVGSGGGTRDGDAGESVIRVGEKNGVPRNVSMGRGEDGMPRSLQRLARLVQSEEFCDTVASTVGAVCTGVSRVQIAQGVAVTEDGEKKKNEEQSIGALGQVLEALLSERGQSLVSVAVSMGARSMVSAYVETQKRTQSIQKSSGEVEQHEETSNGDGAGDAVLEFLSRPNGQRLAVMCISACANSAMKAYMEETVDINYYDQMLSSISRPKHLDVVKECIALFVKVAVTSFKNGSGALQPGFVTNRGDFETDGTVVLGEKDGSAQELPRDTVVDSPCSAVASHEDEVDSDYMMQYSGRKPTKGAIEKIPVLATVDRSTRRGTVVHAPVRNSDYGLVSAIGREWIAVSQDPESRSAIISVVGCATREAVGAVADTIADRLQWTSFLVVLLFGILSAMCLQLLLRVVGLA